MFIILLPLVGISNMEVTSQYPLLSADLSAAALPQVLLGSELVSAPLSVLKLPDLQGAFSARHLVACCFSASFCGFFVFSALFYKSVFSMFPFSHFDRPSNLGDTILRFLLGFVCKDAFTNEIRFTGCGNIF